MSKVKLDVITLLPAVTVDTVELAPAESPVIVSDVVKSVAPNPPVKTYCIGLVVVTILAVAPEDEPVIFSPLTNVPVTVPNVSVGAVASELVSSESNTACNLNTSARPKDISLSVALHPNAPSASLATTLTCLDKLVVLIFEATLVLTIVAITFTFAPEPKIVLSVIVILAVPVPDILPEIGTNCPCTPEPPPAVNIDIT